MTVVTDITGIQGIKETKGIKEIQGIKGICRRSHAGRIDRKILKRIRKGQGTTVGLRSKSEKKQEEAAADLVSIAILS